LNLLRQTDGCKYLHVLQLLLRDIVAVGTIAVKDEVDARVREVGGIAARSFGSESGGSEINTSVCGPGVAQACQSSAVQ
jgi:hypothetical protein